jgi:hypothetical protein
VKFRYLISLPRYAAVPFDLRSFLQRRTRIEPRGPGDPFAAEWNRAVDNIWTDGCNQKRVEWARVESSLGTKNIDVAHGGLALGRCNDNYEEVGWAKLVTNLGERVFYMEDNHTIRFNNKYCIQGGAASLSGIQIHTTKDPSCKDYWYKKPYPERPKCNYKGITWGGIESNLPPIKLDLSKIVIGGCSKRFPPMEWARIVTNAGTVKLDLKFANEIIFNRFSCISGPAGVKLIKHRDCSIVDRPSRKRYD